MALSELRVAFYKVMPSSNVPQRKGPLQIIRCCQNCVRAQPGPIDDSYEMCHSMSFDNLLVRRPTWFTSYQSIQYHQGQFEILKAAMLNDKREVIFFLAQSDNSDINFFQTALKHSISEAIQLDVVSPDAQLDLAAPVDNRYKTIPLLYRTCPNHISHDDSLFGPTRLDYLLNPFMKSISSKNDLDIQFVVVVITKDHSKTMFPGQGAVCIQMLEPFSIKSYLTNALTSYPSTHLVKHIYYNVAHSAAILPTHLTAFLILYLEREDGVSFNDLTDHIEWFCNSSIDFNLQIGFTGEKGKVAEFGLSMLKDFIHKSKDRYIVKDFDSLAKYASAVTPLIAYLGIVSRAILVEYNKANLKVETAFRPEVPVRVPRDDVITSCGLIADELEHILPCRKPCVSVDVMINQELSRMQLSGRYLVIQEPKINTTRSHTYWAGEEDSDEEYFEMNKNKDSFKTWIRLTSNPKRLDRLNLFINAIEHSMNFAIFTAD